MFRFTLNGLLQGWLELNYDPSLLAGHPFAGNKVEGYSLPSPVIHVYRKHGKLGFAGLAAILLFTDTLVTPFPPDVLLLVLFSLKDDFFLNIFANPREINHNG